MNGDDRNWLARKLERGNFSDRFANSSLIRLLITEAWFRLAFLGMVFLVVFLALFLPKMWVNTPPHMVVEVRRSGLDHAQAWALQRAARKAAAEGRLEDAMQAWRGAIDNTPGNPDISRGMLRFILDSERNKTNMGPAISRSNWLLELTRTNRADVDLVARVYEKFQLWDNLLNLLEPYAKDLNPTLEGFYLKALFSKGHVDEFVKRLATVDRHKVQDPELPLFEAAYQAAWGPPEQRADGQKKLTDAQNNLDKRVLASRLQLVVSRRLGDLVTFEQNLTRLNEWRADTAIDQVDFWRFLTELGQKDRALELARHYGYPPSSASETVRLAEGYFELGLEDKELQLLKQFAPRFGYADAVWSVYANLLIRKTLWEDLLNIAVLIRRQPMVSGSLSAYSYFLDGQAQAALKRTAMAELAFNRLAEYPLTNAPMVMTYAQHVLRFGFAEQARALLANHRHEPALTRDPHYWALAFETAYKLKLPPQMLEAAAKTYELMPTNVASMQLYSATLLALREKPQEAMSITSRLIDREGALSGGTIINHCLALLQNQRTAAARDLLLSIDPLPLPDAAAHAYCQAWFEVYVNLQQWDLARQYAAKIDRKRLLPTQLKWLEETERRFPANPKPGA